MDNESIPKTTKIPLTIMQQHHHNNQQPQSTHCNIDRLTNNNRSVETFLGGGGASGGGGGGVIGVGGLLNDLELQQQQCATTTLSCNKIKTKTKSIVDTHNLCNFKTKSCCYEISSSSSSTNSKTNGKIVAELASPTSDDTNMEWEQHLHNQQQSNVSYENFNKTVLGKCYEQLDAVNVFGGVESLDILKGVQPG